MKIINDPSRPHQQDMSDELYDTKTLIANNYNNDKNDQHNFICGRDDEIKEAITIAFENSVRKRLVGTFDKHSNVVDNDKIVLLGDVKAKVRKFEKHTCSKFIDSIHNRTNESSCVSSLNTKKEFNSMQFIKGKPSSAPHSYPIKDSKHYLHQIDSSLDSVLSVYLRIRPPPIVSRNDEKVDSRTINTIEILTSDSVPTLNGIGVKIRTYPPSKSNAAKVVRGNQRAYSSLNTINSNNRSNFKCSKDFSTNGIKEYEFNKVFGSSISQAKLYEEVAAPLVNGLFLSENTLNVNQKLFTKSALLFTYGITNAGKTYTIMGTDEDERKNPKLGVCELGPNRGIIPRTLSHIFSKIKKINSMSKSNETNLRTHELFMSYFEIYNEQIYDLLPKEIEGARIVRPNLSRKCGPLRLREGRNGHIYVRGLSKHRVKNLNHGLELASLAKSKCHISSNNINNDSSRSHCVCQLEIFVKLQNHSHENENDSLTSTCSIDDESKFLSRNHLIKPLVIWIVDLAGSERLKRTGMASSSSRQKESALINSSLMKLMRCLQTISNSQKVLVSTNAVIPFRESKLTYLLMEHLLGPSAFRTNMIINVNPAAVDYDETQHILSYVRVARSIRFAEHTYNRKREAILISHNESNYFSNQLCLLKKEIKNFGTPIKLISPPRKIARMVKKLSPKSFLSKWNDKEVKMTNIYNKIISFEIQKKLRMKMVPKSQNNFRNDILRMRDSLKKYEAKISFLENDNIDLKEKLLRCESDIRIELSKETETQIKLIRDQHNAIVFRLKQQIMSEPTPSKSARKVNVDKAGQMIDELMDKVDECEDEINRMHITHFDQISQLKKIHSIEMQALSRDNKKLKFIHGETNIFYKIECERLRTEIISFQRKIDVLRSEKNEITMKYEYMINECDKVSDIVKNKVKTACKNNDEHDFFSDDKIFLKSDLCGASFTPRICNLVKGRISEVAVSTISPRAS